MSEHWHIPAIYQDRVKALLSPLRACGGGLRDLLFPPLCLGCGQRLEHSRPPLFCPDCLAGLRPLRPPWCRCCGLPFPGGASHLCGDCLGGRFVFDLARSSFSYREPISTLLLSLKFGGRLTGLATLAALTHTTASQFREPDLILPVPLHDQGLRRRGFNQAMLIARACFPFWRRRIAPSLLRRPLATAPQTSLNGKARRENLKGAFALARPDQVRGKRVLLVDDVFTTGSTVNECARVLKAAGTECIEVFTPARSVPLSAASPSPAPV